MTPSPQDRVPAYREVARTLMCDHAHKIHWQPRLEAEPPALPTGIDPTERAVAVDCFGYGTTRRWRKRVCHHAAAG